MNLCDALNEVRRKLGFINYFDRADLEWACRRVIGENRGVFDRLAKS